VEIVVEANNGIPIGLAIDAANVSETALGPAALAMLMIAIALTPVPVLADRAYDCDWLRDHLAKLGLILVAAHRSNRVKEPTNDGRTLRRLKRRWKVERTFAWLHSYRRVVTRYEKATPRYEGFANLACAFIALGNLL
jgi:transposase